MSQFMLRLPPPLARTTPPNSPSKGSADYHEQYAPGSEEAVGEASDKPDAELL